MSHNYDELEGIILRDDYTYNLKHSIKRIGQKALDFESYCSFKFLGDPLRVLQVRFEALNGLVQAQKIGDK